MEKILTPDIENDKIRLKEIAGRAKQDALEYLEERTRHNLFEDKETEEISLERILSDDSFPIIKKAFSDLNIGVGSYKQKYYLEQFAITAGLNIPKDSS